MFATDGLRCECGARMRLVAAIEDPDVAREILECLDLPARAPPLALADPEASAWNDSELGDEGPAFTVDPVRPDGWT